jgi:transketolase
MVSAAVGMAKMGLIPVVATFGSFLTRAFDQLRMAALSGLHVVVCGSHAGVSIGQDGPSQMGLEDIALFRVLPGSTVLYPSDAVSCERLVEQAVQAAGIVYIRTTRPATPIVYKLEESFSIGGSKTYEIGNSKLEIRNSATIVAAGITLHEALKAQKTLADEGIPVRVIDCYSIKPIDEQTLKKAAHESKAMIVVEDHYPKGGLGDAVKSVLAGLPADLRVVHLAVSKIPRSGSPQQLMDFEEIDSGAIAESVRKVL